MAVIMLALVSALSAAKPAPFTIASITLHDQALAGAHDVQLAGNLAFVPGKWQSLSIIDIADPKKPKLLWFKNDTEIPDAETVLVSGDTLLLGTRDFLTINIADPRRPVFLGKISGQPKIDRINGMVRVADHVLAANKSGYIDAFDVGDVKQPGLFGALETKREFDVVSPHDIDRYGDYVVIADPRGFKPPTGKLALFRVFEKGELLPVETWTLAGQVESKALIGGNRVQVKGAFAYVAGSVTPTAAHEVKAHMTVVELSEPTQPEVVAELPFPDLRGPNGLTIAGDVVFCAGGQTVTAYEISNPQQPRLLASQNFPKYRETKRSDNYHDLVYRDGYLYVTAQSDNGFLILKLNDSSLRKLAETN